MNIAYCLICKSKQELVEAENSTFKNGTPVLKGKCTKCGSKLFKILPKIKK